jgi:Mg2+ and Co2+ transporter CorA
MAITDRDYDNLKEMIDGHYTSIENTLRMRKDYWDERINKICSAVTEMKDHCRRQQDMCSIVLKDYDKRLNENTNDITKIKTVGSVLMVAWGAIVTIATQFLRRLG